jgi:hypothetical protein
VRGGEKQTRGSGGSLEPPWASSYALPYRVYGVFGVPAYPLEPPWLRGPVSPTPQVCGLRRVQRHDFIEFVQRSVLRGARRGLHDGRPLDGPAFLGAFPGRFFLQHLMESVMVNGFCTAIFYGCAAA